MDITRSGDRDQKDPDAGNNINMADELLSFCAKLSSKYTGRGSLLTDICLAEANVFEILAHQVAAVTFIEHRRSAFFVIWFLAINLRGHEKIG